MAERYLPVDAATAMNPESDAFDEKKTAATYNTYCASCHGASGQGGLVEGARNFTSIADWKRGPSVTQIYSTLTEGVEGTQMRAFSNLPPWERFALAHYVRKFYKGSDIPTESLAEVEKFVKDNKLDDPPKVSREFKIDDAMEAVVKEKE